MIKEVTDNESYFKMCEELQKVPNAMISTDTLFYNMAYNTEVTSHIYYGGDDIPRGGVVMREATDITNVPVLFVLFQWRDSHFPELAKRFIDYANELAIKKGVKKIVFTSSRKDKVVQRATEKYGFRKVYSVFEKEITNG